MRPLNDARESPRERPAPTAGQRRQVDHAVSTGAPNIACRATADSTLADLAIERFPDRGQRVRRSRTGGQARGKQVEGGRQLPPDRPARR